MRKSIPISLILVVIISMIGICYINSDYTFVSHYDMSCGKGRGIATLILHMCNLSMCGWIYFFASIGASFLLSIIQILMGIEFNLQLIVIHRM